MAIFYYDLEQKRLVSIGDVMANASLPRSVRELSKSVAIELDATEKSIVSRQSIDKVVRYRGAEPDKIVLYFCRTLCYRRGTVYMAIQITHKPVWSKQSSDAHLLLENCNVTPKVYCTDTIHHSAASFGTTPREAQCESALKSLLEDPEFDFLVSRAFFYFTR